MQMSFRLESSVCTDALPGFKLETENLFTFYSHNAILLNN